MEAAVTLAEVAWAAATSVAVEVGSTVVEALSVGATVADSAEAPQAGLVVDTAVDITGEATAWADPTPADMPVEVLMAPGPLPAE